jgi:hypothetical protein
MPITLTPLALCELAHIAVAQLRVRLMVGNKPKSEGQNEKVGATIALLCLSSTVLGHDIYSNLRDRLRIACLAET